MSLLQLERDAMMVLRDHVVMVGGVPTLQADAAYRAVRRIIRMVRSRQAGDVMRLSVRCALPTPWDEIGLSPPVDDDLELRDQLRPLAALIASGALAEPPAAATAREPQAWEIT